MTGVAAPAARTGAPRRRWAENGALAVLAYVPFLLSSPGKVSADTKQYLYLDPGLLLSRAAYLWDPHIGAGTVPHQYIGYLFGLSEGSPDGQLKWTLEFEWHF